MNEVRKLLTNLDPRIAAAVEKTPSCLDWKIATEILCQLGYPRVIRSHYWATAAIHIFRRAPKVPARRPRAELCWLCA